MKRLGTLVASLLLTASLLPVAYAQSPVSVIGPVTPGNCTAFSSNTVIKDAGVTCTGGGGGFVTGPNPSVVGNAATWGNTVGTQLLDSGTTLRKRLTANLIYYVNGNSGGTATCGPAGISTCAAGNDSNDCLTPATACLTLQHAHNLIIANVDFTFQWAGNIYLAHNTGTTNYDLASVNGPWVGTGVINVVGDSSAANTATTITMPANGAAIQCKDLCTIDLQNVACADNGSNNGTQCIIVGGTGNAGHVDISNVTFGACTICTHIFVGNLGSMTFTGPITVAGGGASAISFEAADGGLIDPSIQTVTVTGTPQFLAFAYMLNGGVIKATNTTFSGSATGPRCIVAGPLNLGGYNPNAVFPGNTDCVANEYVGAVALQTGTGGSSSFSYGTAGQVLTSGGGATAKNTWTTPASAVTGANPTATAGPTVVNGAASTFMRSDAAPPIQLATSGQLGLVQVDNTSITASAGIISSHEVAAPVYVSGNWYTPQGVNSAQSVGASTQNNIFGFFGYVTQAVTIKSLGGRAQAGTSGGKTQFAVYSLSGNTLTLVDATGDITTTAGGAISGAVLNTTDILVPGVNYFFAMNTNNSSIALVGWTTGNNNSSAIVGSATLGDIIATNGMTGKTISQTYGTWPAITVTGMSDIIVNGNAPGVAFQVN